MVVGGPNLGTGALSHSLSSRARSEGMHLVGAHAIGAWQCDKNTRRGSTHEQIIETAQFAPVTD